MLYICLFFLFAACFLLGMVWLRVGLFNISGTSMENWLRTVTATPFKGMLAGTAITAILQSSSAVTVITVGLVSARILAFPQTIGIILGTNIGTTITLEFLTFNLTNMIIPFLIFGFLCLFFKNVKVKSTGYIFIGIGIIFAAMKGFGWLADPLTTIKVIEKLLFYMNENILFALLVGIIITAIIQSSTVVIGIAMSFFGSGLFPLETGIAIMIGSNIGTCSTALLAGIGAGREARLAAYAHMWLNIGGAILFFPFISSLAEWSGFLASHPATQLAHASVIYNIICSLLVLPFANQFGSFIHKVHNR